MTARLFNDTVRGLVLTGVLACATPAPTNLDEHWGEAQRTNVERMIADPRAGERNTEPVQGMGAATAADVIVQYHEGQKRASQETGADSVLMLRGD